MRLRLSTRHASDLWGALTSACGLLLGSIGALDYTAPSCIRCKGSVRAFTDWLENEVASTGPLACENKTNSDRSQLLTASTFGTAVDRRE